MEIIKMQKSLLCLLPLTLLGVAGCKSETEQEDSADIRYVENVDNKEASPELKIRENHRAEREAEKTAHAAKVISGLQNADKADLIAALEEKDPSIKKAAIERLQEMNETSPSVMEAMVPLLANESKVVRNAAATAMSSAGGAAVATLIDALHADAPHAKKRFKIGNSNHRISFYIVSTLATIKKPAVGSLVAALATKDDTQKMSVIRALGLIGEPSLPSISKLIKLTGHPNHRICGAALVAIVQIDPENPKVIAAVKKGMASPEKAIADKARIANSGLKQ